MYNQASRLRAPNYVTVESLFSRCSGPFFLPIEEDFFLLLKREAFPLMEVYIFRTIKTAPFYVVYRLGLPLSLIHI